MGVQCDSDQVSDRDGGSAHPDVEHRSPSLKLQCSPQENKSESVSTVLTSSNASLVFGGSLTSSNDSPVFGGSHGDNVAGDNPFSGPDRTEVNPQSEAGCGRLAFINRCLKTLLKKKVIGALIAAVLLVIVFALLIAKYSGRNHPGEPLAAPDILRCNGSCAERLKWLFRNGTRRMTIASNGTFRNSTYAKECGLGLTEFGDLSMEHPPKCTGEYRCEKPCQTMERNCFNAYSKVYQIPCLNQLLV